MLRPRNLHWIQGADDDPYDTCAHGNVDFRIGDDVLLETNGNGLSVSGAALYLLRTLSMPHAKAGPFGDQLFPCCGIIMPAKAHEENAVLCGCNIGEDFEILHTVEGDGVIVRAIDGREWRVRWPEWREAVFAFADRVSEFYAASSPKQLDEADAAGFKNFQDEWSRRRGGKG